MCTAAAAAAAAVECIFTAPAPLLNATLLELTCSLIFPAVDCSYPPAPDSLHRLLNYYISYVCHSFVFFYFTVLRRFVQYVQQHDRRQLFSVYALSRAALRVVGLSWIFL